MSDKMRRALPVAAAVAAAVILAAALFPKGAAPQWKPLLLGGAGASALGLLLLFARKTERLRKLPAWVPALALAAAFLVRAVLSFAFPGYAGDVNLFSMWAARMTELGPGGFYAPDYFADYPPGYMYVLWGLGEVCRFLGLEEASSMRVFILTLPGLLCDLGLAVFVYCLARQRGGDGFALSVGALLAFSPVLLFDSIAWKQVDSVLALGLAGCFYLLYRERWVLSALVFTATVLLKPQALMFGPVLALGFLLPLARARGRELFRVLLRGACCALLCVGVLALAALPFWGEQEPLWLWKLYTATVGSYPMASINGFNLFAALGGMEAPLEEGFLLTFGQWGALFIFLSTAGVFCLGFIAQRKGTACLPLLAALYGVTVFTLAHQMHERYSIPAFVLLAAAYALLRRRALLCCALAQDFLSFMNVAVVLLGLQNEPLRLSVEYKGAVAACSVLQVALTAALWWVCIGVFTGRRPGGGEERLAPSRKRKRRG